MRKNELFKKGFVMSSELFHHDELGWVYRIPAVFAEDGEELECAVLVNEDGAEFEERLYS